MNHQAYQTKRLKDYIPSNYLVEDLSLTFILGESITQVDATMRLYRNPALAELDETLYLVGEDLKLINLQLDGKTLTTDEYAIADKKLKIFNVPKQFTLKLTTEIKPKNNTELMGLYKSNDLFCTQCESEGFRKIIYYLDRPDVMTRFSTKIIADKKRYPVLLSNGNLVEQGDLPEGQHFVVWQDPFKKPSYLFALVAGKLDALESTYVTMSQRQVSLKIFVEKNNLDKCHHALESVKKAMRWDEVTFGREYDLDIYMIVAVSDFNMGAMENKGLNIFNSKYVLANSQIATDTDYKNILSVIGHEYFHNWSGNRVTCRDWFQLSLKEGLTIYRDQAFSADMADRVVERISDVRILQTYQFAEDAGPMAHPVRPDSYIEINNFYTHTVYEKGAEVIRMMETIVGKPGFRAGMDIYFERHDGQAVTIEDFVRAMEDANHVSFEQFRLWYSQAGTPFVKVRTNYDAKKQEYTLIFSQTCAATPGQERKLPFHIPIKFGLLKADGSEFTIQTRDNTLVKHPVMNLIEQEQSFTFTHITEEPIPSLFRDFSAPVNYELNLTEDSLLFLIQHDNNFFNRWDALQKLYYKHFNIAIDYFLKKATIPKPITIIAALEQNLLQSLDVKAFVAELMTLPTVKFMANRQVVIDVEAVYQVHKAIREQVVAALYPHCLKIYQQLAYESTCDMSEKSAEIRALKNVCLSYLISANTQEAQTMCVAQYHQSLNMTDRLAALSNLVDSNSVEKVSCLDDFYQRYQNESLVIDKWFAIQAMANRENTLDTVAALTQHPAFNLINPNRTRALLSTFTVQNFYRFHRADGKGYQLLTDNIIKVDSTNPILAARLLEPLISYKQFVPSAQERMREQLQRISKIQGLSNDLYEIISKSLK